MSNKSSSLWISGLLTGAVLGYYLYKNRDKMPEQKEKLKTLISDLKEVALDLKTRIASTADEAVSATKSAIGTAKDSARDTAKDVTRNY